MGEADMPKHLGGLHIEHQPHKGSHETIEQWAAPAWRDEAFSDWVSDEQRLKAIETDSLWVVQWYPDTPVGFHCLAGADLDVVLAKAREISPP